MKPVLSCTSFAPCLSGGPPQPHSSGVVLTDLTDQTRSQQAAHTRRSAHAAEIPFVQRTVITLFPLPFFSFPASCLLRHALNKDPMQAPLSERHATGIPQRRLLSRKREQVREGQDSRCSAAVRACRSNTHSCSGLTQACPQICHDPAATAVTECPARLRWRLCAAGARRLDQREQ